MTLVLSPFCIYRYNVARLICSALQISAIYRFQLMFKGSDGEAVIFCIDRETAHIQGKRRLCLSRNLEIKLIETARIDLLIGQSVRKRRFGVRQETQVLSTMHLLTIS
jgi:hypothetical protein